MNRDIVWTARFKKVVICLKNKNAAVWDETLYGGFTMLKGSIGRR